MCRVAAPIALALGGVVYLMHSVDASQARLEFHPRSGPLAAMQTDAGAGGIILPGAFDEWQYRSELLVLRNRTVGSTKKGFVFCALPSNGGTMWKKLMLRVMGSDHWHTTNGSLVHHPVLSGLDLVGYGLPHVARDASDISALMGPQSKTFKAVVVRDPITRALSSYLERCVVMQEWYRCKTPAGASFEEVISTYEATGHLHPDHHFMNQTHMCGLQHSDYTSWDMVLRYEHFAPASKRALETVKLWNDFGSSGWGPDGDLAFGLEPTPRSSLSNLNITDNREDKKEDFSVMHLVCHYYTPELLDRVASLYWPDIQRFHYAPRRHWNKACWSAWKNVSKGSEPSNVSATTDHDSGTGNLSLPGKFTDWQRWSELAVLRDQPINGTKRGFVFCALPHEGATAWHRLMMRAMGLPGWREATGVHDPARTPVDMVGYTKGANVTENASDVVELMGPQSKTFKAIMVRDPITRMLAAYLDWCVHKRAWYKCKTEPDASFEEVVTAHETTPTADPMFMNQTQMCGLRHSHFTTWDMIGRFEEFSDDAKRILQSANLWEDFGSSGWGADGDAAFGLESAKADVQPRRVSVVTCQYYTPGLLKRVAALYLPDMQRFGYKSVEFWTEACANVWQ